MLAEANGWSDATVVKLISDRLKGMARRWYDSQDTLSVNWGVMKTALIKQFYKPVPYSKMLREAALYEAQPGQDLTEHCFNKITLLRNLNPNTPEEYLVDGVIGGVGDENISRAARSAKCSDSNELYAYLSTVGRMPSIVVVQRAAGGHTPGTSQDAAAGDSESVAVSARSKCAVQCYNCKGSHFARDCPKPPVTCYGCKRPGHLKVNCPNQSATGSKTATTKSRNVNEVTPVKVAAENPYLMLARVNGKRVRCLVDTGSSCTLLRQSVASALKLTVMPNTTNAILQSFTGETVRSVGTVVISLQVGQAVATIRAVVLPKDRMRHDVIVGVDFLNLPNVMVITVGNDVCVRQLRDLETDRAHLCAAIEPACSRQLSCGDGVSPECRRQCEELLEEFSDRVCSSLGNLGKTDGTQMVIRCTTDQPIVYRPYRMPETEKVILRSILKDLLENDIIRESDSPYASPVLLVKKRTGDFRMCVDYRRLNAITVKDKYPLPLIEDQIDRLGGNRYFIGLDLASGFYQVPMSPCSIAKTAFVTPEGHYEFLRMPFGLTNSPAVFQRLINNVLGPLKNSVALPYMDDIIIPARTEEEGLLRLRKVLEALRQHNLTLNLDKCSFFKSSIDYLGREISAEGVRPGRRKIEAVLQMHPPQTVREVRQFLGLAGYFRRFVKDYARLVEPLTRLTKASTEWQWTTEQEDAFRAVQEMLTTRPVLAIFDPSLPTELHADASSMGLGAILLQTHDGVQRVVAYYSKQTTVDQRQYHSYELETMAVVYALRHFRVYLLGLNFVVVTDCSALRTTFLKKDLVPRVARWWLEVQEFSFEIKYRPGARMTHVDTLSRYPIREVNQIDLTEGDWVLAAQMQDEQLRRIRKILEGKKVDSDTKHYFNEYMLKSNRVYKKMNEGPALWVVPKDARWQICRLCHDDAGHQGVENTLKRVRNNYWFAGMRRFITKYIRACLHCSYYKHCPGKKQGALHPIEKVNIPFDTIHIDHLGPFETSPQGSKYLFVIVDAFTKFTIIEPVKNTRVKPVVRLLQAVMGLFGVPRRIISDRGSAFTSLCFKTFCDSYGVKHILNAVATPRANGQCERYNRTILAALATTCAGDESTEWDSRVKQIQSAINTAWNKGLNSTPAKALFGYQPRGTAEASLLNTIEAEVDRVNLAELRGQISEHITQDQRKQKERYDKLRRVADMYAIDDVVMILITSQANTGSSKKLHPKFRGPFRVTKRLYNDRYEVEDLREGFRSARTVVEKMKRWCPMMA